MMHFVPNFGRKSSMIDFFTSLEDQCSIIDPVATVERKSLTICFLGSLVKQLLPMDTIAS